jgi:hypothetical protein
MYLKQVSNEALRDITPEQVAIAYRSLEDGDGDGDGVVDENGNGGVPEDRIEPGLRTNVCLMVDEECMRSIVAWRETGSVPFVKAVDVLLGEEDIVYSGCFRVAITSLFTEFYIEQVECGETVELVPEGDREINYVSMIFNTVLQITQLLISFSPHTSRPWSRDAKEEFYT